MPFSGIDPGPDGNQNREELASLPVRPAGRGDIVLQLEGEETTPETDLFRKLSKDRVGTKAKLSVVRNYKALKEAEVVPVSR